MLSLVLVISISCVTADDENETTKEEISKDQGQMWSSNYDLVTEEGSVANEIDTAFGVGETTGHIKGYPSEIEGPMTKHLRAVSGYTYGSEYTFTISEDGEMDNQKITATINNTLIDNGTVTDSSTRLMWMADDATYAMEWKDALAYCEILEYAGYDDWKLPDIKELQSIVDYTGVYPTIDHSYFNTTQLEEKNPNYYYWSSTSAYFSTENPLYGYAWYVAFGFAIGDTTDSHGAGAVRFSPKSLDSKFVGEGGDNVTNSVRACRIDENYYDAALSKVTTTAQKYSYNDDGEIIYPKEGEEYYGQDAVCDTQEFSFTDNGDGTITDNVTGLVWQQTPTDDHYSITSALEFCENLEIGNVSDWRLPTLEELYTIQDFSEGWPYVDQTYFNFPSAQSMPPQMDGKGGPQGLDKMASTSNINKYKKIFIKFIFF
ncbi:MAG: DUF1566 domain-containing protein [Pleomorphochaeta sp.]